MSANLIAVKDMTEIWREVFLQDLSFDFVRWFVIFGAKILQRTYQFVEINRIYGEHILADILHAFVV